MAVSRNAPKLDSQIFSTYFLVLKLQAKLAIKLN
jgi:hypothetical protein